MKYAKILFVISSMLTLLAFTRLPRAFAFFDQLETSSSVLITIGDFSFELPILPWDPNTSYQIGDRFTFDGKLWEVRALGDFTRPPEGDKLRPFGPYQEVTDEYRSYNTYFQGDIVIFNGLEYEALFNGMSGQTPGTVTGWQALTDEWQPFNVYFEGDIVTFNGIEYEALFDWVDGEPGTIVGWNALVDEWQFFNTYLEGDQVTFNGNVYEANWWNQGVTPEGGNVGQFATWRLIQTTIEPGETTHNFDSSILDATITLDGVVVVLNGQIQTANANALGITITKEGAGSSFWEFRRGSARLRIRDNGTYQFVGGTFTFDSIVIDLP